MMMMDDGIREKRNVREMFLFIGRGRAHECRVLFFGHEGRFSRIFVE